MSIKSPCIDVCKFDKTTSLCTGCYRTKQETKDWKKLDEAMQLKIIDERDRRKKLLKTGKGRGKAGGKDKKSGKNA